MRGETMKFQDILEDAVRAPSGDNCQPWRFEVKGGAISIHNVPERDTSLFNFNQRASYVAHGALLENLVIAASSRGYKADIHLFPDPATPDLVAIVHMLSCSPHDEPLQPFIRERTTNRGKYDGKPLMAGARTSLMDAAADSGCSLYLAESKAEKSVLADVLALNDRLVFENEELHRFLYDHIRWTAEEVEATRDGLDLRSLELSFPDSLMFPILKNWSSVRALTPFGLSRLIGQNARKLAMSASAIGVIAIPGTDGESFIAAGRALERIWLEATRLGLSFQMMTGITFLIQRLAAGALEVFTSKEIQLLQKAQGHATRVSGENGGIIFRVGNAPPPTVTSARKDLANLVGEA